MNHPSTIEIESQTKTVDTINQKYYRVSKNEKRTQLHRMLMVERPESCLIFCNTRYAVDQVQKFLTSKGYASKALHGDVPQEKRLKIMEQFKRGDLHLLVATDVAARGIHIDDLSLVINYDVPLEKDNYIHRIGRTGRAGKGGSAITLVTGDDIMSLYEIEEHIGAPIEESDLPADSVVEACKADAEKWIKEKYQESTLASTPTRKATQENKSETKPGEPGKKRRRRPRRDAERPREPRPRDAERPREPRPEASIEHASTARASETPREQTIPAPKAPAQSPAPTAPAQSQAPSRNAEKTADPLFQRMLNKILSR